MGQQLKVITEIAHDIILLAPTRVVHLIQWQNEKEKRMDQLFKGRNPEEVHAEEFVEVRKKLSLDFQVPLELRDAHRTFTKNEMEALIYYVDQWCSGTMTSEEVIALLRLLDGELRLDWAYILFCMSALEIEPSSAAQLAIQVGTRNENGGRGPHWRN